MCSILSIKLSETFYLTLNSTLSFFHPENNANFNLSLNFTCSQKLYFTLPALSLRHQ